MRAPSWLLGLLILAAPVRSEDDKALGLAAFQKKDFATAFEHLNSAYSADASDAVVGKNFYIAAVQVMAGALKAKDFASVEDKGQWAAGVDVNHVPEKIGHLVPFYRGQAWLYRKEWDKAIEVMEAGKSQYPHPALSRELGQAYFVKENFAKAVESFQEYMDSTQEEIEVAVYIVMARSQHGAGDVASAVATLNAGLEKHPGNEAILTWLKHFGKEYSVESGMDTGATWHFEVRFQDIKEQEDVRRRVLTFLEEAYNEVTRKFSYYPEEPTQVVLYASNEEMMSGVNGAVSWMAACYNGKMRIPLKDTELPDSELAELLRHEFTHAIVSKISQGKAVPGWLNEGLAQILEGEDQTKAESDFESWVRDARGQNRAATIPLTALGGTFQGIQDRRTVRMAYVQSMLFTQYLEGKFGFWKVQQLVQNLGEGSSLDEAVRYTFGGDMKGHEEKWLKSQFQSLGL